MPEIRKLTNREIAEAIRAKTGYLVNPQYVTSITAPCGGSDSVYYSAFTEYRKNVQFLCRVKRSGVVTVQTIYW